MIVVLQKAYFFSKSKCKFFFHSRSDHRPVTLFPFLEVFGCKRGLWVQKVAKSSVNVFNHESENINEKRDLVQERADFTDVIK